MQSLRGPRGGMIFFKKDSVHGIDLESAINNAVFPGLQVRFWFRLDHITIIGKMLSSIFRGYEVRCKCLNLPSLVIGIII